VTVQVIGTGLSRTGTLSLKVALERLGYGPCYHAFEYLGAPGHVDLWHQAIDQQGNVDWDQIFHNYRSVTDVPSVLFWRQLIDVYPEARVILTERDPARWYDSVIRTIERGRRAQSDPTETIPDDRWPLIERVMAALLPMEQYGNRGAFIETYRRHNEAVKNAVSPERLLIFRAVDGWGPLAQFLGVEAPEEPFPHLNAGDTTHANATLAATRTTPTAESVSWA
jgi:hypothetical protein